MRFDFSLVDIFEKVEDTRQQGKVKHLLLDIIFIAIVATVAGIDDWEDMEEYALQKEVWFRKYLELPNGVPSCDTIKRAFQVIEPKAFLQCFMEWTQFLSEKINNAGVIAIDGKTMRSTYDDKNNKKALHIVSGWFSETGMVLGQVKTFEKSNEITAIPELLDILAVTGNIVTIDAMGTQKDIAEKIISKKGDYVLALKGNHPILHSEVIEFFKEAESKEFCEEYAIKHITQNDKGHGRIEKREYYITSKINWMDGRKDWKGLNSIGMVVYTRVKKNEEKKTECRYFLCSINDDVDRFAYAVRKHWGIESMHWSLDVTFREDSKRTRKENAPINLSMLYKIAYNILKNDKTVKKSIKTKRLRATLNEEYLEKLLSGK